MTTTPRALVCLAIAFAGSGLGPARAEDAPPPGPVFPTLPAEAPAGTGMLQPCLEHLEGRVRCGRYRVYEDREAASGRTLDLAFVLADSLDPAGRNEGALTFFFGGPGTATTGAAQYIIAESPELRRSRDLLFLDFRGVGESGALTCEVPYPGGVASRFGQLFPLDHVAACRDALAQRAGLDLYTSNHTMDDLDELRGWLNYDTLDLMGGSYGTLEAQVFLRRHPQSVRTLVLDGIVPLGDPIYLSDARGLQDALDHLIAECGADADCARAYPRLAETVEQVLERVRTDPPEVVVEGRPVRLGPGEVGYALRGLLYQRGGEVPRFIHRAAAGDWQPLADYYLARSGWVSSADGEAGMHFSVLCAEDISRLDPATIARETAGTFLGDHLVGGYARVCELWPHARLDPSFWEPVESDVPALLFSGGHDPVTPPAAGERLARRLTNSLHIVVPGAGHGVDSPCARDLKVRFLDTGTVAGLDTSCLTAVPGTDFVLPEEPEAETSDPG